MSRKESGGKEKGKVKLNNFSISARAVMLRAEWLQIREKIREKNNGFTDLLCLTLPLFQL